MNYVVIYEKLILRAKNRKLSGYVEKHHIVPKCLGGSDNSCNLTELTAREHFIAHKLLCKIYPDHTGLKFAVFRFLKGNTCASKVMTSSAYEILKIERSKEFSKLVKRLWQNPDYRERCLRNLHTESVRKKLTNRKLSTKHRQKLKEAKLGKSLSENHKLNISKSLKNYEKTILHRENIRKSKLGKLLSKKHKQAISESHKKKIKFNVYKNQTLVGTWTDRSKCMDDLNLQKSGVNKAIRGDSQSYKGYIFEVIS